MMEMKELNQAEAMAFHDNKIYDGMSFKQKAVFQINQKLLCMPFSTFHEAVEKTLDRPVWTHEFGLNYQGIKDEVMGIKSAPTFEEILALIPPEKLVVVSVDEST